MEWKILASLGSIALLVIGLIVFVGFRFSKRHQKKHPDSELVVRFTLTGNILTGALVVFWGACVIAFKLAPHSTLGTMVHSTGGAVSAFLLSWLGFVVAAVLLEKMGFPITDRSKRR